ncbi:MAG: polysaccharide deacetylase family protein [Clostridiales bacterium]|jgi:peptidoglycan/xylan/chitin deacetylase (PgdA/CDA1 family)|nr:polysaccharide deacetylase family protein [Clostridiales bacterium]
MAKGILKYLKQTKRHLKRGWSIFFFALPAVVITTLLVNWLWPKGAFTEAIFPVYEYGVTETIINDSGNLHVYLTYPSLGIDDIDKNIAAWAQGIYDQARQEFLVLEKKDPLAELEVNSNYNSYFLHERFVSVENHIFYNIPSQSSIQEDAKVFNVDLENKKFLKLEDILDKNQEGQVLLLLKQKILDQYPLLENHISRMDFRWLDNLVLTHEGAAFILPKGQFLPAYVGSNSFILSYQKLGNAFILLDEPLPLPEPMEPEQTEPELMEPEPTEPEPTEPEQQVKPQLPPSADIDPQRPMIALTFDDGPSKHTRTILTILAENEARATFFVLGDRAKRDSEIIRRAVEQGSEVAGHSWSHKNLTKLSKAEIKQDLEKTNQEIYDISGIEPMLYRPPYGAVSDSLKTISQDLQLSLIMWSLDTRDWKKRDAGAVYKSIMDNVQDGSIILCHDLYESTADAMKQVIPALIEKGYQLVTVSELLEFLEPGVVYTNKPRPKETGETPKSQEDSQEELPQKLTE